MADDLVERLEARCDHTEWDYLCVEAADRITALRALAAYEARRKG